MSGRTNPPLRVVKLIATRKESSERGTKIWMNKNEARIRLLEDGELVWVYGPRRHELAELAVDDSLPRGQAVLRDVVGASPSEVVTIVKVDTDARPTRARNA